MTERLRATDFRFIAVCLALLAAATWFSVRNFCRAFPEASINFQVNRDEAAVLAGRFLAQQGYSTAGYRQASSFGFDDQAKTFLEREAGLEEDNRIMGSRVRLWHWSNRWFRPLQKEEFRADITPAGEAVGFAHELAEDAARPAATAAEARALAENFLRDSMRRDPAGLEFVEESDQARPHRTDRTFTWKERDFNLHDATNRVEVTVLGNEVGGYREYLKVPDQWTRDYERLRSKNEVTGTVDVAVMLALVVGLIVTIVTRVRRQDIRWRRAAWVGAIGVALSLCSNLNEFPLSLFGYPTTDSYESFISRQVIGAVVSALAVGGLLFVLAAGAEPLYREAMRDKISLGNLFGARGLRTRRFLLGAILGITLTGLFIAYQTGFYIVASRLGAWSPADVPYSDLLNTRFPWLFVLFGGYLPAVSEEFLFRMFAIPFLRKLVRWMPAALVLAGFIWGFGHATYPNQPFYIRGVEVGIGGLVLGLIMLRWGILPTLVWHYSVDAMYSAMLLLRSHSLYFRLSGAASAGIVVLPIVLALAAYWRRGGFEPEAGLLNGDEAGPVEPPAQPAAQLQAAIPGYRPLERRAWAAALALLAVGLLALRLPVSRFGDSPEYKLGAAQSRVSADAFVRAQGLDPDSFRHVTYPVVRWDEEDSLAAKYFLERQPTADVSARFEGNRPLRVWNTRYYRSLDKEEITVAVHPETGKVLGFSHALPEDRPGADIEAAEAQRIASAYAASQGFDTGAMDLKESQSEKKKARRDHNLVWEARPGDSRNLDEAHFRLAIGVAGDRVTSARSFWKIPEDYSRARERQNAISIAVLALRIAVMVTGLVWTLWLLIQNIRKGMVPWVATMRIALPASLLTSLGGLLALTLLYENYPTAIPISTFQTMAYVGLAMAAIGSFLLVATAVALVTSFFPESATAFRAVNRRVLGRDAAAAVLAAVGLELALRRVTGFLALRFHGAALYELSPPNLLATAAPAVSALTGAVQSAVLWAGMLAAFVLIARHMPRRWLVVPMVLLAMFAAVSGDVRTPGELALEYGGALLFAGAAAVFCYRFGRSNPLAYAVVLWLLALRGRLAELAGNDNPSFHLQGWIVTVVLVATVVWAVAPGFRKSGT